MECGNTILVSTRITEEEKKFLSEYCKKHDEKIARVLRRALREYLAKLEKE